MKIYTTTFKLKLHPKSARSFIVHFKFSTTGKCIFKFTSQVETD